MTPTKAINFTRANHRKSLDGLKTQTRRPTRKQPTLPHRISYEFKKSECLAHCSEPQVCDGAQMEIIYPRYYVGDILAMRTTWAVSKIFDSWKPRQLSEDLDRIWFASDGDKADDESIAMHNKYEDILARKNGEIYQLTAENMHLLAALQHELDSQKEQP